MLCIHITSSIIALSLDLFIIVMVVFSECTSLITDNVGADINVTEATVASVADKTVGQSPSRTQLSTRTTSSTPADIQPRQSSWFRTIRRASQR